MRRRDFLAGVTAAVCGGAGVQLRRSWGQPGRTPGLFVLSKNGCGRATGYSESNKIVTIGDRTHVAWLDSIPEGFRVCVRTLDRTTGNWSPTLRVGHGHDNHGGPALTVDSKGYLHLVYFPHHHPFHYRRSKRPNDTLAWTEPFVAFGKTCTYPTLMCGPDDTLILTCRESAKPNWFVNMYTKRPDGEWEGPHHILRAMKTGYAHFQEALAWGPDHRTLHMSIRFYDGSQGHTIGYLRSDDYGKTWKRSDGAFVELPATAETVTNIVHGRDRAKPNFRCGAIAVDSKNRPHILYSSEAEGTNLSYLAFLTDSGQWQIRTLKEIQEAYPGWQSTMPGGLCISSDGTIHALVQIVKCDANDAEGMWAHPSTEIVRLTSRDNGQTFRITMVSQPNPDVSNWLPNIERPTGFNRVDKPSFIYTGGQVGEGCSDILSNDVVWVE